MSGLPPIAGDESLLGGPTIFDRILAGEAPASFVYRSDRVAAFMDIQPVNPGHVLVVPVKSVRFIHELDDEDSAQLFLVARQVAAALRTSELPCEGVNLFVADGVAAGQEVGHVHLHVFPRFKGDSFGLKFAERYFTLPPREQLDQAAEQIRRSLEKLAEQ